jgi:hypothetical protein
VLAQTGASLGNGFCDIQIIIDLIGSFHERSPLCNTFFCLIEKLFADVVRTFQYTEEMGINQDKKGIFPRAY